MNTLNKNLELRKALAEVDRLTSENVDKHNLNIRLARMLDSAKEENSKLKDKLKLYIERWIDVLEDTGLALKDHDYNKHREHYK